MKHSKRPFGHWRFEPYDRLSVAERIKFKFAKLQVSIDFGYSRCDVQRLVWYKIINEKIVITLIE